MEAGQKGKGEGQKQPAPKQADDRPELAAVSCQSTVARAKDGFAGQLDQPPPLGWLHSDIQTC